MCVDARGIKQLRKRLGLTQQAFASLLGISFVSVNKWENSGSSPTGLSAVLLQLLANATKHNPPAAIITRLRQVGPAPLEIIRALVEMEKHHERMA